MAVEENILADHDATVDPQLIINISVGFLIAFIVIYACLLCPFSHNSRPRDNDCRFDFAGAVFLCIFLTIFFIGYGSLVRFHDEQEYHGKMRVTDVTYRTRTESYTTGTGSDQQTNYETFYDAIFRLDWGYQWACPNFNNVSCTTSTVPYCQIKMCGSSSCTRKQRNRAVRKATKCATNVFDTTSNNYTGYDPTVGPSNDIDWPNVIAFGDCDTCEASLDVASPTTIRRYRYACYGMLGLTIVIIVWCLVKPKISCSSIMKFRLPEELLACCRRPRCWFWPAGVATTDVAQRQSCEKNNNTKDNDIETKGERKGNTTA